MRIKQHTQFKTLRQIAYPKVPDDISVDTETQLHHSSHLFYPPQHTSFPSLAKSSLTLRLGTVLEPLSPSLIGVQSHTVLSDHAHNEPPQPCHLKTYLQYRVILGNITSRSINFTTELQISKNTRPIENEKLFYQWMTLIMVSMTWLTSMLRFSGKS